MKDSNSTITNKTWGRRGSLMLAFIVAITFPSVDAKVMPRPPEVAAKKEAGATHSGELLEDELVIEIGFSRQHDSVYDAAARSMEFRPTSLSEQTDSDDSGQASVSVVRLVDPPRNELLGDPDVLFPSNPIAPPSSPFSPKTPRQLILDGTGIDYTDGRLHHSPQHEKLQTNYLGDVASSSLEFSLENHRSDGRHAIISGLGLNVHIFDSSVDADSTADVVPEQVECRVKLYTKRSVDTDGIIMGGNATTVEAENNMYQLALDAKIMCAGEEKETLLSTELFIRNYRAKEDQVMANTRATALGLTLPLGGSSEGNGAGGRALRKDGEKDLQLDVENIEEGTITGAAHTASATDIVSVQESDGLTSEEKGYPLLIPPNETISLYIVVLPPDDAPANSMSFLLLSSSSANQEPALYITNPTLHLYEGSSIINGYLIDPTDDRYSGTVDESKVLQVQKPTVFNGAVYYDTFNGNEKSLGTYYDELEYSLLPGDSLHGRPGCDKSFDTGYVDTVGSYGFMFDVSSAVSPHGTSPGLSNKDSFLAHFKNVEIYGMDMYIRNFVNVSFEVYARDDGGRDYVSYAKAAGQTLISQNWRLIARGVAEGQGPDVPTPIPAETWRRNVVVEPGVTVGFYVTVKGAPNLRYRNTTLAEGEVFSSDGILDVAVGRSWGEHPLRGDGTDVFFSPREFSGGFRYHVQEGLCESDTPSTAPTFPHLTPSPSVSVAPTPVIGNHYEDLEGEGLCPNEGALETTFRDGTGSFGALFDMLAKTHVTLTGIDLNIDWNTGDSANVLIFARQGSWFGHQNNADSWSHLLVNTTLHRPDDFHNRSMDGPYIPIETKRNSAIIARNTFEQLAMKPGETWSLYICTSLADFRYTLGTSIGKTFAANSELRVMEGAGAADWPPFKGGLPESGGIEYTFYAPRVFNGKLHYDYVSECPSERPSAVFSTPIPTPTPTLVTSVTYMFYVEHSMDKLEGAVTYDMSFGVRAVLDRFLGGEEDILYGLATKHELVIETVTARLVSPAEVGYLCYPTPPETCTAIAVDVTAAHRATATEDDVMYALLRQSPHLPSLIDVEGYTIENVGEGAVQTSSEITLSGVPDREMEEFEQEYFAQVVRDFLDRQVKLGDEINDSLMILSVVVNGQEVTSSYTIGNDSTSLMPVRNNPQRRLEKNNKVKVSVRGKYRPPPELDFGEVVEDSINRDRELLEKELNRNPPPAPEANANEGGELGVGNPTDYFLEAEVVGAREIKEEDSKKKAATTLGNQFVVVPLGQKSKEKLKDVLNYAAMGVGGLIVLLSTLFLSRPHRRRVMFGGSGVDNQPHRRNTQRVDSEDHTESFLHKSRAMISGWGSEGLTDSGNSFPGVSQDGSSDKNVYNPRGSTNSERMLALSDFSNVPQSGGSFNSDRAGFDPQNSATGGFDPHGSATGGFDPRGNATGVFDPHRSDHGAFDPRRSDHGFVDSCKSNHGGFDTPGSGTSGFDQRGSGTNIRGPGGAFDPRSSWTSDGGNHHLFRRGASPATEFGGGEQSNPLSRSVAPQLVPNRTPDRHPAPPRRHPLRTGEHFLNNSMPPMRSGPPPVANHDPHHSMPPQRGGRQGEIGRSSFNNGMSVRLRRMSGGETGPRQIQDPRQSGMRPGGVYHHGGYR